MTELSNYNDYGVEIEQRLRLGTSPIAIKLLKTEEDIPEEAIRPKRDLGLHLGLCQGFAMSRRDKATVAMLKEDNWCYVPVLAFGLAKPPEYFLEGHMFFPDYIADVGEAKRLAATDPHLEFGKYIGVASAPLKSTKFKPDVVVIYCDVGQLRGLVLAMKYKAGYQVTCKIDPMGACYQSTVPVILSGECQITVPCGGDTQYALAQDDEMVFSLPAEKLDELILGLRNVKSATYPGHSQYMRPECPLSESYVKLGKMIGMDVHE